MTDQTHHRPTTEAAPGGEQQHRGHGLMMIACCIPMLVIAVALVASGAVSPGFVLVALGCTAMMALMMRGMHGESDEGHDSHAGRR